MSWTEFFGLIFIVAMFGPAALAVIYFACKTFVDTSDRILEYLDRRWPG